MKYLISAMLTWSCLCCLTDKSQAQLPATAEPLPLTFFTHDVDRFWLMFDMLAATGDSTSRVALVDSFYLSECSYGLQSFNDTNAFDAGSYVSASLRYPTFIKSVRAETERLKLYLPGLNRAVEQFRAFYPEARPADFYYFMGPVQQFRFTEPGRVMFALEYLLANAQAPLHEFPVAVQDSLRARLPAVPADKFIQRNMEAYVQSLQQAPGRDLLSQSLHKGIALYLASQSMAERPDLPALAYGKANRAAVLQAFEAEMFSYFRTHKWIDGDSLNQFQMRDLGYYIGYAFAEQYFGRARNKPEAIHELLSLPLRDAKALAKWLDKADFFTTSLDSLQAGFIAQQPSLVSMKPAVDQQQRIPWRTKELVFEFSKPLDPKFRPLLQPLFSDEQAPDIRDIRFSSDYRSLIFSVRLKPDTDYRLIIDADYCDQEGRQIETVSLQFKSSSR